MILMQGQGVSKGVARGEIYFYRRHEPAADGKKGFEPALEKERLAAAQAETIRQLEELACKGRAEAGLEAAELFGTHALMAGDEDFTSCIREMIEAEECSAEYAVQAAAMQFARMFEQMDDEYMQARAADIRDVARRMNANLTGKQEAEIGGSGPVILAADDLAPSETIRLDKSRILALITRAGSANSHTAILARSMGIPAVCGLKEALKSEYAGQTAWVDGESGQVILEPDDKTRAAFEEKKKQQEKAQRLMEEMRGQEEITPDGRRISIYCNIASHEEVQAVLANDGRGIGLFRSEFLFMASAEPPSEEEQFNAYRAAAAAMNGMPVIIRTLDVGADKQTGYLQEKTEGNPALGMRGVRICLKRPDLFRTQLRALYRASAYGRVSIMFPMISSVWEVRRCRKICREVLEELDREGAAHNRDTEIGVMIETPASVLIARELAQEVDFFSVGTNDLTQYTLACDRQLGDLGEFFDSHHPAVLRSIRMAAEAAHEAGIWIGVCGELAADPKMLPFYLELGIDELSVPPCKVLPLRMELRKCIAKAGHPGKWQKGATGRGGEYESN